MRVYLYAVGFAALDIFPLSFYGRNLAERLRSGLYSLRLCVPALLNVVTLIILIITITLVAGIYLGTTGWFKDYIENNKKTRIVEVNAVSDSKHLLITPSILKQFTAIKDKEGKPAVSRAYGWNDVILAFYDKSGVLANWDSIYGRTVAAQDPLLEGLDAAWPPKAGPAMFTNGGQGEIVADEELLRILKYDVSKPPASLYFRYKNMPCELKLRAVCKNITGANRFLLTPQFYRMIESGAWMPRNLHRRVLLGPLPLARGLELFDFEIKVQKFLAEHINNLAGELLHGKAGGSHLYLKLKRKIKPAAQETWKNLYLAELKLAFPAVLKGLKPEFVKIQASKPQKNPGLESSKDLKASVYVRSLEQVPDVVDALEKLGFVDKRGSKSMAIMFSQISSFGQGVILAVIITVGLLTGISISLSFAQRIQRKIPEIGILKAFGTGDFLVFWIYSLEALIIWIAAMLLSWSFISWAASLVNRRLVAIFSTQEIIDLGQTAVNVILIPPWLLTTVGAGSLLLCWLATMIASLWAVRMQPAQAIKTETC